MALRGSLVILLVACVSRDSHGQRVGLKDYNPNLTTFREGTSRADVQVGDYDPRYGTYVGPFSTIWHDVVGDVYAVDNITIHVRGFSYDGEAPDAHFFAGNRTPQPTNRGFIIPNDKNRIEVLGPYRNRNLNLKFPVTKKGQRGFFDIKWISVWCAKFSIDFGHVVVPAGLQVPQPAMGGALQGGEGLRADYVMRSDNATFTLVNFSYDASDPGAIFVMTYKDGTADPLPNEKGSFDPITRYNRKTIDLEIPPQQRAKTAYSLGVYSAGREAMLAEVRLDEQDRLPPARHTLR